MMSSKATKKSFWIYLTLALLIIGVALLSLLFSKSKKVDYRTKANVLTPSYTTLINTQVNLYEFIGRNKSDDFRKYFPEYKSISKKEFEDKIRENIVSLKMRGERLEMTPSGLDGPGYKSIKQSYIELMRVQIRTLESLQ